jgi:RNA polymerase sigma-70 factor (ECF subfamily)
MIVQRYYSAVYSLAWKLTRHTETALDVAQETFLRAFARLDQHDPAYSFASWLFKIAANHIRDLHRSTGRAEPPGSERTEPPDAAAILERAEDLHRMRDALNELPPDTRTALVLHLQEGFPVREIGFVLDQTENAVRMKIYRGLQWIRARVRED